MDILVPDIGDFKDVPVIEILVKNGDRVKKNDSLIALESDKATMEVPSPADGTIGQIHVSVGDKVSQGSPILTLSESASTPPPAEPPAQTAQPARTPASQTAATQTVALMVPDIGDFKDVPVVDVFVKPGDRIEKDASVVALESDKATMEVPATTAGIVRDVLVKVGDKVSQGAQLATIEQSSPAAERPAAPLAPTVQSTPAPPAASAPGPVQTTAEAAPSIAASGNGAVHASPSTRRFARELGVDLHGVRATGPNGRITRDDVQQYVKTALKNGSAATGAVSAAGLHIAPWPVIDFAQFGEIERKPLSRIKKISGPNLHRNWVMIPHVTQNDDADVTDLEEFRKQLNGELAKSGIKVTMLAFLMRACVAALKKFPDFNTSLDGDALVYKQYYNIGFAADTPGGLVVPVVRDADRKGIADLARETSELSALAREGKLTAGQMQGGTFTISSLGSIGGTYFTPIINAPEVAILGACRAAIRPVWDGSAFVPRLIQPLSLSYDHRVIDGAAAARFTAFLSSVLSDLRRALL